TATLVPHAGSPTGKASAAAPCPLEGPIAVNQQYRNSTGSDDTGTKVSHRQIELAIAVEVAHGQEVRAAACLEGLRRLEGPIAIAQQHRNRSGNGGAGRIVVGD